MPEAALAVISDLDGTLVDTHPANEAAYSAAFAHHELTFDEQLYSDSFGLNFPDLMARLAPGADSRTVSAVKETKARIYPDFFHLARANVGLVALLESLHGAGVPIALATTARRQNAEAVLAHFGLAHLFRTTVAGEDVVNGKPAPDCYVLAAHLLGVPTSRALVFEDSTVGVRAAEAAGCDVLKVAS